MNPQDAVNKLGTASERLKPYDNTLASLIAGTAQDIKYELAHGGNYSRPCLALQHYGATLLSEGGENVPEDVAIAVDGLLFDASQDIGCSYNQKGT